MLAEFCEFYPVVAESLLWVSISALHYLVHARDFIVVYIPLQPIQVSLVGGGHQEVNFASSETRFDVPVSSRDSVFHYDFSDI